MSGLSAPAIPTVIGERYRVLRELGRGGVGTVYLVSHARTGERFALKVLHDRIDQNPEAVLRFEREMRMPAAIRSPHVVKVTDAGSAAELGGALFMVMEVLDGLDVSGVLAKRRRLTGEEVLWTLDQTARGLEKIHGAGLVHRDLKPENLFVHRREEGGLIVKILDFGLVRQSDAAAGPGSARLTQVGTIVGTPLYVSPEQAMGELVGPQADIWALGMIAYELLTGKAYWETDNLAALLLKVVQGNLMRPTERAPGLLPSAFDGWFLRSCARDPKARFPSVSEQTTALAEALGLPSLADAAAPPSTLQALFSDQPSSPPPSKPDRAARNPQVTDRVEPRPHSPEDRFQSPRRLVPLLFALLGLVLVALVFSLLALRRPVERAAPPAAEKTTPPALPTPAPPPEKTPPVAPPPRGRGAGEALKHKQVKKPKAAADKARDLSSFDPAAP